MCRTRGSCTAEKKLSSAERIGRSARKIFWLHMNEYTVQHECNSDKETIEMSIIQEKNFYE
jgi:hypothetical protein